MLKTLKCIASAPLGILMGATFLLLAGLAGRIAQANRQRGARMFHWLAKQLARLTRGARPEFKGQQAAQLTAHALLLQGAPWEQVRPYAHDYGPTKGAQDAFEAYFADENYDQAARAAADWCRATGARIAGREAEMRLFFATHRDLSLPTRGQILMEAQWDGDENAVPKNTARLAYDMMKQGAKTRHISRYFAYYDAHLALQATQWMQRQNKRDRSRIKTKFDERTRHDFMGLPRFFVDERALRAMGLKTAQREAIRRRATGEA